MQTEPTERQQIEAETPRDGEAIRTADVHARNATRRALAQLEAERAAPRLRAKAAADEAKLRTREAVGAHAPLPNVPTFVGTTQVLNEVAASLETMFGRASTALDSPHMDGPKAAVQLTEWAQGALNGGLAKLDAERNKLKQASAAVEARVIKALTPPPHLAAQVPEARALLCTMPDEQRYSLIANARGDDIELLMYAVGGAPAFLSGVVEGKRVELRTALLGVRDPEAMILESGIPTALALLDKAEEGMRRLVASIADPKAADAIRQLGG